MSEQPISTNQSEISGQMLFYEQPELLSPERHAGLGLSPVDAPFEFAKTARSVPIVLSEIVAAQKFYPVVFTTTDNPELVAALGVLDSVNLFVTDNGHWQQDCHVPLYVDCHPIAFARSEGGQAAIVIDRASPEVTDSPRQPFFVDGELAPEIRTRVDHCRQFQAEHEKTKEFGSMLKALGLLSRQEGVMQPDASSTEEHVFAEYASVDLRKLSELGKDELFSLQEKGFLAPIYAQIFSLHNWRDLLRRRTRRLAAVNA